VAQPKDHKEQAYKVIVAHASQPVKPLLLILKGACMAIIKTVSNENKLFANDSNNIPTGTYSARCVEVIDKLGAKRKKYGSDELEEVDLTAFQFEFSTSEKTYRISTNAMKISADSRSRLFTLLSRWLGKPPELGFDTQSVKGMRATISVSNNQGVPELLAVLPGIDNEPDRSDEDLGL